MTAATHGARGLTHLLSLKSLHRLIGEGTLPGSMGLLLRRVVYAGPHHRDPHSSFDLAIGNVDRPGDLAVRVSCRSASCR